MTEAGRHVIRRLSVRVALVATALVAVAYFVVAIAVVSVFTQNQLAQVDARLTGALQAPPHEMPSGGGPGPGPKPDHAGGLPFLSWIMQSDGTVRTTSSETLDLPAAYQSVTGPETVTILGADYRIAGVAATDGYHVVAQLLSDVNQARWTVIQAEILIAPLLLIAVFLGAVLIGRRVATPIEAARQRQLEFTADASHELRTPLSVIEAHTSLALSQPRDATWFRTAFERVDRESKRMHRLVDDLLWLARFDATSTPPNAEPVDVGLLAAQAVDRFGVIAEARRLELRVEGREAGAVVTAPPDWLDRLLGVLLDNACKYSPDGGVVTVGVALDGPRVRLTVDDTGPGIPEAERDRVFDRFHRAAEGPGGAGLGLAIADAIVRATGGRWQVGASPSGGARMAVTWNAAFKGRRESSQPAPRTTPAREG